MRVLCAMLLAAATPLAAQEHVHEHASPYAGLEARQIKALSAEEQDGLLAGRGMGAALAAELNGYPGPRHVLELSSMLGLTPEQEERTREIYAEMEAEARELGARVVELEGQLDAGFASGTITESRLQELTGEIAAVRGRLRASHLRAHLLLHPVLTPDQRTHYRKARGYGG